MTIVSFVSGASPHFYFLCICRVFLGFLVGFFAPLGATIVTEVTPIHVRGKTVGILVISMSLG